MLNINLSAATSVHCNVFIQFGTQTSLTSPKIQIKGACNNSQSQLCEINDSALS